MSADIHGLVGAYAVEAVDDSERAAFEAHLAECPECRAEVSSLREAAAQLGVLAATAPPSGMRDAVLARIATVRPLPPLGADPHSAPAPEPASAPVDAPSAAPLPGAAPAVPAAQDATPAGPASPLATEPTHLVPVPFPVTAPPTTATSTEGSSGGVVVPLRRRRAMTWLAGVAAAAALVIGGLVWSPWSDSGPGGGGPVTATERVLEAKDAQRFVKVIDGARATIVRSPSLGKAVLIADNMPSAPAGKDFQIWFDQPGKGMQSALVMPHGSAPTVTVMLEGDATTATGAGITLEPAGGSPEPTSAPLALFSFS
ncbi:anti-sigma factor domain-containing protein [Pedococcus sp. NPDC057267]|uniref:anti-sigma factor n=1 Tax=Pedococcus sp. NPDC057267 TaxID=3346077 RepID=UPI003642BA70